ncbi:MAG: Flp family type IVb pilin [Rhizobiaceae bacterium]
MLFLRFLRCQSGTTAIEYGAIGVLISVAIVGAVTALGSSNELQMGHLADQMPK